MRSKTTNLNSLYDIKLHRFIWTFYPKDLFSSTYNLIHICDTVTFDCSSEYASASLKGWKFSTLDLMLESFEWEIRDGMAY